MATFTHPAPRVPPSDGATLLAEYEYLRGSLRAWRLPDGAVALDRSWTTAEDGKSRLVTIARGDRLSVVHQPVPLNWSYVIVRHNDDDLVTFDVDEDLDDETPAEVREGLTRVIETALAAL
jgi:hypothetical protein